MRCRRKNIAPYEFANKNAHAPSLFTCDAVSIFDFHFSLSTFSSVIPAGIYLLKVNNRNTRTRCEICSKLTIKTPHDAIGPISCQLFIQCKELLQLSIKLMSLKLRLM